MLAGKQVILGITGSIAAYKAADIAGRLVGHGAQTHVVMTRAAREFISPLTLEALTGRPVYTGMFGGRGGPLVHLDLARTAHLLVVAPATANVIGKAASGVADDLLSTLILAFRGPVLFCPAMNPAMFDNPIVQKNIGTLKAVGYSFCGPESGRMACGDEGRGRLAAPELILERITGLLRGQNDFAGLRVLVTAGPTHEALDPVRYLTNRSSGRMGYAVARAARDRGAAVVLVSGPSNLPVPDGVELVAVTTAAQMSVAVKEHFPASDVLVMAAAVADYRPEASLHKLKKGDGVLTLTLKPNEDILTHVAARGRNPGQVVVGFAAETGDPRPAALEKALRKGADLMVGNNVTQPGSGFFTPTNQVVFAYPDGRSEQLPELDKYEVAWHLLDRVLTIRGGRGHA
ncbi:MAG: bifunctional phosphopantothenoylcysteine decarboxylase/phosphopantothenate--cysteine ligase CoaBC [Bacillota bacterium]